MGVQAAICRQAPSASGPSGQCGAIVPYAVAGKNSTEVQVEFSTSLLRQAAGLEKGAKTAGREVVGTVTDAQVTEIAQIKLPDLNANDLAAAKAQVAGTARSMGIRVSG